MTQSELKKEMISFCNGAHFINLTQLTLFMGLKKNSARHVKEKYLQGVDRVDNLYFIDQVAERIMARRDVG